MSEMRLEQTESPTPPNSEVAEPGEMRVGEGSLASAEVLPAPPLGEPMPAKVTPPRRDRVGTVEHLAARRAAFTLDADAPDVKQRLSELRTEMTTLVTDVRWGGLSTRDAVERIIPLLNVGSLQQWASLLVTNILEIDRAGNLVPVWLKLIEREEPQDLPPDANPAETMLGRARRFAVLMLGNYKSPELSTLLGELAIDANVSLYATQSLVKQGTTPALQALVGALKSAEGWAKVDVVEACLRLDQPRFFEILLASGLDRVVGLESYVAVPLYRVIPLEGYLRGDSGVAPRLAGRAALVFGQILQDSITTASVGTEALPIVFERDLPPLATALFEGVRGAPNWQNVIALHRLAVLLGRYWGGISRGVIQDQRIVDPVSACLPMMPEVERWMNGPGRDILLAALSGPDEEGFTPAVRALGELREPRVVSILTGHLDSVMSVGSREQAQQISHICDALGRLGDRRAIGSMTQMVSRVVNVELRTTRPRRRDNLVAGDADIPGSIVYAAVLRAFGQFGDRAALDFIVRAASDFDPVVRTAALETLKRVDFTGEDMRSRLAVREALSDPRDSVVRAACQLALQYRDMESVPALRYLVETRSDLAPNAYDALRQLGQ